MIKIKKKKRSRCSPDALDTKENDTGICMYACSVVSDPFDPLDCILLSSSARGFFQARILEWGDIPFSRGSSQPRDRTQVSWRLLHWQADSLPLAPPAGVVQNTPLVLPAVMFTRRLWIAGCHHFSVGKVRVRKVTSQSQFCY